MNDASHDYKPETERANFNNALLILKGFKNGNPLELVTIVENGIQ